LEARTALTGSEVDLGSNDELFWFWVRRNEPPAVYFARHAQRTGNAAQQLMPIEPQWLLDALGFAEFRPTDRHEGPLPIDKYRVEITSYMQSANGPIVKRTVVDAAKAIVLEQHVYDASGNPLASAIAKSHRYIVETATSLPQVIEIRVPPAQLAMTIDVGTVDLNRLGDNPQLWTLPIKPGSPAVDLGVQSAADPSGGVPSLGQQITDANWFGPGPAYAVPPTDVAAVNSRAGGATTSAPTDAALSQRAPSFVPPGGVIAQTHDLTPGIRGQAGSIGESAHLPAGGIAEASVFAR
jgi:hypothetical protein